MVFLFGTPTYAFRSFLRLKEFESVGISTSRARDFSQINFVGLPRIVYDDAIPFVIAQ